MGRNEKSKNWLPTGDGAFSLMLRIYLPTKEVTDGEWIAPSITKVD